VPSKVAVFGEKITLSAAMLEVEVSEWIPPEN